MTETRELHRVFAPPHLHDAILEDLRVEWELRRVLVRFVVGERDLLLYATDFLALQVPQKEPWGPNHFINETRGPQKLSEGGSRFEIEMRSGDVIAIVADRFDFSDAPPSTYDMYKGDAWFPPGTAVSANVAATLLMLSLPGGPAIRYTEYSKNPVGVREWMRSVLEERSRRAKHDDRTWSFAMLVAEHTPDGDYALAMFERGVNPAAPAEWPELPFPELVAPALRS